MEILFGFIIILIVILAIVLGGLALIGVALNKIKKMFGIQGNKQEQSSANKRTEKTSAQQQSKKAEDDPIQKGEGDYVDFEEA